jgi:hypothetical protein
MLHKVHIQKNKTFPFGIWQVLLFFNLTHDQRDEEKARRI